MKNLSLSVPAFHILMLVFILNHCTCTAENPAGVKPDGLMCELLTHPELSLITDPDPEFGWIVNSDKQGDYQSGYTVMVATSLQLLNRDQPDMWNSGMVETCKSINIIYAGKPLESNSSYWWKVRTYNALSGESDWSAIQKFNTGDFTIQRKWPGESRWIRFSDEKGDQFWTFENRHPVIYHTVRPVKHIITGRGTHFIDFGKSAFSSLGMELTWTPQDTMLADASIEINIGEKPAGDSIDQKPGGGVVFRTYRMKIRPGTHNYTLQIPRFVPRYPHSQVMPQEMPEVAPFRYCELMPGKQKITVNKIEQKALYYLFDDSASAFTCSDDRLNKIYDLCKYSIKVNTYNGDYSNSERERMMYEADCYIQQTGHYAIDREYAIARYSLENLIYHATWPTEWISHSIFMAYADYLYTGNTDVIRTCYEDLKAKTLTALETEAGLISTRTGLQTKAFLESIHFNGRELRDIVDWPHGGMGSGAGGETDDYDFRDYNTVVNAFYYKSLVYMSEMSEAIGKENDAEFFLEKSESVKRAFNAAFMNREKGIYSDGIGSSHFSLHASLYPLCFGLVPEEFMNSVISFIRSKGMACGVYSANYLLEALFNNDVTDYAFSLLTSSSDRSWLNMIRVGSTMTTEAWDNRYKSNNGWSHTWSASPVHIIPRKILGIEPEEPGFGKIRIRPHPGPLEYAKIKYPTIRGPVMVEFINTSKRFFELDINIPVNITASVFMPALSQPYRIFADGRKIKGVLTDGYIKIENVTSGRHKFVIKSK